MAKTFSAQTTYEMSAEEAFARHTDEAFLVRKFEALGAQDVRVQVERSGEDVTLTIDRKIEAEVPGFAKRVVKPTNNVHLVERWHPSGDGYACEWQAETSPAPSRLEGTRSLSPANGGVSDSTHGSIEVKVPIIGGRLADWLSGEAQRQVDAELAWIEQQ